MKEIKRYNLLTGLIQVDLKNGKYIEHSDYLKEVEQLQARIKELESAERTLNNLGYRNLGGEFWKPPIGKKPDFNLIDSLNERIKELESQSHINEIKAQGIEDMLNDDVFKEYVRYSLKDLETTEVDDYTYLENVRNYAKQLRTKHD